MSDGAGAGAAQISVAGAITVADTTSLTVTVSAPDITTPITKSFVQTNGIWQGTIGGIPAGVGRTFTGKAYNSSNVLIFSGAASNVAITAGTTAAVALVLEQASGVTAYSAQVPRIDSLVASSLTVSEGGTITLTATAHDPVTTDAITYAWSGPAGMFASPTATSTTWTAPSTLGPQVLTLSVTDANGLTASMNATVQVSATSATGSASVNASFNFAPNVTAMTATPTLIAVGQSTTVSVTASDPQGSALNYAWTAVGCTGSFSSATSADTLFTLAAPLPASGGCNLKVTVTDAAGSANTGTLGIQTGAGATVEVAPQIDTTYQSTLVVGADGTVTLQVSAHDPQNKALTFTWAATAGQLAAPATTSGASSVVWTAPPCIASGTVPTITVTVKDTLGLAVAHSFVVTGSPSASCLVTIDANMQALWKQSTSPDLISVLASGQVLNFTGGASYDPITGAITVVTPDLPTADLGYGPASTGSGYIVFLDPLGNERVFAGRLGAWVMTTSGALVATVLDQSNCCDLTQIFGFDKADGLILASGGDAYGIPISSYDWSDLVFVPSTEPTAGAYYQTAGSNIYFTLFDGSVSQATVNTSSYNASQSNWHVTIDSAAPSPGLHHGAIDSEGSLVVTSTTLSHGVLASVSASGTILFNTDVGASSSPVVAADNSIYVGALPGGTYAVESYSAAGSLRWSTPVNGPPVQLLLADDSRVYAFLASTGGDSEMVALDQATGALARDYINLPPTTVAQLVLSNGTIFAEMQTSGGTQLWALQAGGTNYDPMAPWPVERHDNYLSSDQ